MLWMLLLNVKIFFFQAEDGIRDWSVTGVQTCALPIYVNGIALGVIELKRGRVDVAKGIRQNLDNQKKEFIPHFFTTMQLVMAGNDTQGLRYGTIETPEKYYLTWKEENPDYKPKTDPKSKKYLPTIDESITNNADRKSTRLNSSH